MRYQVEETWRPHSSSEWRQTIPPERFLNTYLFAGGEPLGRIDPLGLDWSDRGKAVWTALKYKLMGSEIPEAAMLAAATAKALIINAFNKAVMKCHCEAPDPVTDCAGIMADADRVKAALRDAAED